MGGYFHRPSANSDGQRFPCLAELGASFTASPASLVDRAAETRSNPFSLALDFTQTALPISSVGQRIPVSERTINLTLVTS